MSIIHKLNLQWVTDSIEEEYKKWKQGDIVKIQAQTGTGKTYFIKKELIPYMSSYEKLLYVCNRTNLKRQLKKDLLEQFGEEIPYQKNNKNEFVLDEKGNKILDINALDNITTINNVTITSYHAIQHKAWDEKYKTGTCNLNYDYIVLDECHYLFIDGSFNQKCFLAFDKLIKDYQDNSIKIFISATMDELEQPINMSKDRIFGRKPTIWTYTTGIDYSYINTQYFKKLNDIINIIKNDNTNEKWLVFVSNIKDGKEIKKELGKNIASFIHAKNSDSGNLELTNIINNSKFEKKVLITTKILDNGINIDDDKLKNIVVMAWDKITFIQMLGRKRVKIDNAQDVNLFISTRYKKSFTFKLLKYREKKKEVELLKNNENEFNKKYDNELKKIGEMDNLFYRDKKTSKWKINKIGNLRLELDIIFAKQMEYSFNYDKKFAFIKEQLKWLGLASTFNENNLIEDVILEEDIESLKDYLEKMFSNKDVLLQRKDREELIQKINLIDGHNSNIKKNNIKYVTNIDTLNSHLEKTLQVNYRIKSFQTSRIVNDKKKKYKSAWKIIKIIDSLKEAM